MRRALSLLLVVVLGFLACDDRPLTLEPSEAGVVVTESDASRPATAPGAASVFGYRPTPTGTGFVHVTSGVQDTASVASLSAAQGGTGLTSIGGSGTVLQSNGSVLSYAAIVDANVATGAAIQGTKITTSFGNQAASWGTNVASTGTTRWGSVNTADIRNNANSGDLQWFSKDTSDDLFLGNDAFTVVTLGNSSAGQIAIKSNGPTVITANGFYFGVYNFGAVEFPDGSNPGLQAGVSSLWSYSGGHPACTDGQGNISTMQTLALSLLNNATTTSSTASNIDSSLTAVVTATDIVDVVLEGTNACSSTGGVVYGLAIPTSATIEGNLFGFTGAATTLAASNITAGTAVGGTPGTTAIATVASTKLYFRLSARVKMDGTHSGNVTPVWASKTNTQTSTDYAGLKFTVHWLHEV